MLTNLTDLRKGLGIIMAMERKGMMAEAQKNYDEIFVPSLKEVGDRMGKTPDEVRALLEAPTGRRAVRI